MTLVCRWGVTLWLTFWGILCSIGISSKGNIGWVLRSSSPVLRPLTEEWGRGILEGKLKKPPKISSKKSGNYSKKMWHSNFSLVVSKESPNFWLNRGQAWTKAKRIFRCCAVLAIGALELTLTTHKDQFMRHIRIW